ncbi:hypothetical protein Q3G72_011394 [Acer saccharum]|nr:hypothetical protein Q3G72_011394 [Acer saccharum]
MRESVYLLLTVKFGNTSKEGFSHYKEHRGLASPDTTKSPQLAGSAPRSRLCKTRPRLGSKPEPRGMRFIHNGTLCRIINKRFKTNSIGYGHVYNMDIGPKRVGISIFSLDMETVRPLGVIYRSHLYHQNWEGNVRHIAHAHTYNLGIVEQLKGFFVTTANPKVVALAVNNVGTLNTQLQELEKLKGTRLEGTKANPRADESPKGKPLYEKKKGEQKTIGSWEVNAQAVDNKIERRDPTDKIQHGLLS